MIHRWVALLASGVVVAAGSCRPQTRISENSCPTRIRGSVAADQSGIGWGGTPPKADAEIRSVAVECLPIVHPAVQTGQTRTDSFTDYRLDSTAYIASLVLDKKFVQRAARSSFAGALTGTVVFDAVSGNGTVLGSTTGTFRLAPGLTNGTASGRISGLSASEIERVVSVRARWEYGR